MPNATSADPADAVGGLYDCGAPFPARPMPKRAGNAPFGVKAAAASLPGRSRKRQRTPAFCQGARRLLVQLQRPSWLKARPGRWPRLLCAGLGVRTT